MQRSAAHSLTHTQWELLSLVGGLAASLALVVACSRTDERFTRAGHAPTTVVRAANFALAAGFVVLTGETSVEAPDTHALLELVLEISNPGENLTAKYHYKLEAKLAGADPVTLFMEWRPLYAVAPRAGLSWEDALFGGRVEHDLVLERLEGAAEEPVAVAGRNEAHESGGW